MQVNKRSTDSATEIKNRTKRFKTDASDVAEAALKFDNGSGSKSKKHNKEEHDNGKDIAIDSELLSHNQPSFTQEASEPNVNEEIRQYEILESTNTQQASPTSSSSVSPSIQQHAQQHAQQQVLHQSSEKPLAGTDEWHRIRKDNHKEVERRRRENINAGIKELASLLPTQDTNKSQILQRAIEYIRRLKENENNNIEKWTLEKLLTDQAVAELTSSNDKLKAELERAYREVEHWKKACSSKEK